MIKTHVWKTTLHRSRLNAVSIVRYFLAASKVEAIQRMVDDQQVPSPSYDFNTVITANIVKEKGMNIN